MPSTRCSARPDPLQERGDRPRRAELADEIDRADVDAELERGGGDDGPQLAGPRAVPRPRRRRSIERLPWWAATISSPSELAEEVGDPLGHPAGVDEDERRAVRLDVLGDQLEDRGQLLVGRDRAELVVGQLDGDVERAPVADVDDRAARRAVCGRAVRARADEQAGDRRDRALSGRAGRSGLGGAPPVRGDDAVEALEAEGQVRASLVPGEGVDLVDDHGVARRRAAPGPARR